MHKNDLGEQGAMIKKVFICIFQKDSNELHENNRFFSQSSRQQKGIVLLATLVLVAVMALWVLWAMDGVWLSWQAVHAHWMREQILHVLLATLNRAKNQPEMFGGLCQVADPNPPLQLDWWQSHACMHPLGPYRGYYVAYPLADFGEVRYVRVIAFAQIGRVTRHAQVVLKQSESGLIRWRNFLLDVSPDEPWVHKTL